MPRKNFRFEFETLAITLGRIFAIILGLLASGFVILFAWPYLRGNLMMTIEFVVLLFSITVLIPMILLDPRGEIKNFPPVTMDGIDAHAEPNEIFKAIIPFAKEATYNGAVTRKPYGITIRKDVNNALLLTDRALYSIYIPMEGAGLIIGGRDVADFQVAYRSKELGFEAQRLEKMRFSEILSSVTVIRKHPLPLNNPTWTDWMVSLRFSENEKKYWYNVASKTEYLRLKALLTA